MFALRLLDMNYQESKDSVIYPILNCFNDKEIIKFLIERNESEVGAERWFSEAYLTDKDKKIRKFRKQKLVKLKKILEICL